VSSSSVPGTNVAPITFPGIVSGIDYNSIITKLTSLTLAPTNALNAQLATLNNANLELIKINNMLESVQNAIANLSNPSLYSSYDATSSNTALATAKGIAGQVATPGTYVIESASVATSTVITNSTSVGHKETDLITSGTYAGLASDTVPLVDSYAAVQPNNGTSSTGQGQITVDGVQIQYNVNSQSIDQIFTNINNAVHSAGVDASFNIGFQSGTDVVAVTGTQPITLGSASDTGNLLSVLKLDQAQNNTTSVTGTSGVGGLSETASLDTGNDANLITPISSGTFTINGVQLSVDATGDNIASVLAKINASSAGVTASYDAATNHIALVNNATGTQSIVLGSSSDTSNFLSAVGLTTGSGATTAVGKQSVLTIQNASGVLSTVYSGSNAITTAIPGIEIDLTSAISSPVSITVAKDTTNLVNALNTFVSAYNAAIGEINSASAPPIVSAVQPGTLSTGSSQSFGGGVLYGNSDVQSLRYQLTNIVGGMFGGASDAGYNSLAKIGLTLDDSFSTVTTGNNGQLSNGGTASPGSTSGGTIQNTTYQGTDGQLQPLNTTTLLAALQANPNAVSDVLNGANGLTQQLGTYLTGVTGAPTLLNSGPAGNIPTVSLLQNFENNNTNTIQDLQQQIKQITSNANQQANNLRSQFVASETLISGLQSEQQQLAAALGFTVSSSSSSS